MAWVQDFGAEKKDGVNPNDRINHDEHQMPESARTSPAQVPYQESGALINRTETADERWARRAANRGLMWPKIRHYCRKPLSEFAGTFILIMFGDGVVAQVVLSGGDHGDYQSISWGWGKWWTAANVRRNIAS